MSFPFRTLVCCRCLLLSMVLAITIGAASAHEIRPTIADVEVGPEAVNLSLRIALEPLIAGIDLSAVDNTDNAPEAAIYDRLRALGPEALEAVFRDAWPRISDGLLLVVEGERLVPEITDLRIPAAGDVSVPRDSILIVSAPLPPGEAGVQIGLAPGWGTFIPRQTGGGYEGFLAGGELTPPLVRAEVQTGGAGEAFLRYLAVGLERIVPLGPDHVLFVLGLFFYASRLPAVLWQVAAFTAGYGATLALAATGTFQAPGAMVAPLIAVSLVFVGIENAAGRDKLRGRCVLVFAFGLVHGLGLGADFGDYGIVSDRLVPALIGFAIGVEIGVLAVVCAAFALAGWFMGRTWYRRVIAIPASLAIAAIGAYWTVERILT